MNSDVYQRSAIRWIRVYNADSEPAPSFALLAVTGVDSAGNLIAKRPAADSQPGLLVNGPGIIASGAFGQAHATYPAVIAYQAGDVNDAGTDYTEDPEIGETWGAAANSWVLQAGRSGYRIVTNGSNGNVNATALSPQFAVVQVLNTTPVIVELASEGIAVVYAAQTLLLTANNWTVQARCWYLSLNGETPILNRRYDCDFLIEDSCAVPIFGSEITGSGSANAAPTTTLAPCLGTCKYTWSAASSSWSLSTNGCSTPTTTTTTGGPTTTAAPGCSAVVTTTVTPTTTTAAPLSCQCVPPAYCGTTDGECTVTNCTTGMVPGLPACSTTTTGPTTTTTSGPTTTTTQNPLCTTTVSPTCTQCCWAWDGLGWVPKSNGCAAANCTCPGSPASAGNCGDVLCLSCITSTQQGPACGGTCDWKCVGHGFWLQTGGGCLSQGSSPCSGPCACQPPSSDCSCGATAQTFCYWQCPTTTGGPTTACPCGPPYCGGTTSTTVNPCGPNCAWGCDGSNWYLKTNPCVSGCNCCPPGTPCTQACQTAQTTCNNPPLCPTTTTSSGPTTTTTGGPTTTTTTPAPCGTCTGTYNAQCQVTVVNNCTGGCVCGTIPRCPPGGGNTVVQCISGTTTAAPCTVYSTSNHCTYQCVPSGDGLSYRYVLISSICTSPCGCCYDGGICFADSLSINLMACNNAAPPSTTSVPAGSCSWMCGNVWSLISNGCSSGQQCSPPSGSADCQCNGTVASTPCLTTTTGGPTTTANPCSYGCQWTCASDGTWKVSTNNCNIAGNCNCDGTTGPCSPVGSTRVTACVAQTTTTTTVAPPCGTCTWQCATISGWNLAANNCSGACNCRLPQAGCTGVNNGQIVSTNCA